MGIKAIIVLACLSTLTALAQVDAAVGQMSEKKNNESSSDYVLCKNLKAVRTIRIENDADAKQCVALYTKLGVDKEVGRAQNILSCRNIIGNIKGNLEKASWKCKELDNYNITTSAQKEE
ncbi:MAG: hypothetical protein A2Z20_02640 [Bdellovibrionales bacterium RBG_16_40_8]|nr:MAG: hypothetical protein A2Z20_02640 [Bdellovibrionales bacterium RBG_16_40_8]